MPVRKIPNRRGVRSGLFSSHTTGSMIPHETLVEKDLLILLDYSKDVTHIESQPYAIPYKFEGKPYTYYPDFRVTEAGKTVIYECKAEKYLLTERNQVKYTAADAWCRKQDFEFRVISDKEIRAGYRLSNIKFMRRYAMYRINKNQLSVVKAHLHSQGGRSMIGQLINVLPSQSDAPLVYAMLYHHQLVVSDLNGAPLSPSTSVRIG